MAGIYMICFIVFPIAVFANASKVLCSKNEFLNRQDANVVKGIATCFVMLAHLTIYLENIGGGCDYILKIFTVMGGMGVLLFFFLSGYGLYKGYEKKRIGMEFWKKRIFYMYFPCVVIQFIFYLIQAVKNQKFVMNELVFYSLFSAWFIDVILIQYFIFFITGIFAREKRKMWVTLNFFLSLFIAITFWKSGFNARWYNGLMLFSFGMLIAYTEEKLITLITKNWNVYFAISLVSFGISGMVFTTYKSSFTGINVVKTFSGMCLSMITCFVFLRMKLKSRVMRFIGKRSLFFYIIHVNLLAVIGNAEGTNRVFVVYSVMILTFLFVITLDRLKFGKLLGK